MTAPDALRPADAVPSSWVDRLPGQWQPYARLMRLDRPIGTWLLLWPCLFGLLLASPDPFDPDLLAPAALFAVGALVMRAAGCVINDLFDADLDARVARTAARPIPAGLISKRQALLLLALLLLAGLAVLVQFNRTTALEGLLSLLLVVPYPLMKRITWWPQVWLGLTFNYGALLGWSAVTGSLALPAVLLYAGCLFWTLGYDTIYALQDRDDDMAVGIRSSAIALGNHIRPAVAGFYFASVLLCGSAILTAGGSWTGVAALLPFGAHLAAQVIRLQPNDAGCCLRLFRSNRDAGALAALAMMAAVADRADVFSTLF